MGDVITFNIKIFKALASRKRIKILQVLEERQKTVSELHRELNLSKSTLYENLGVLLNAGLIQRIELNNKFVYYKLSDIGQKLLNPQDYVKVSISVITSALFIVFGLKSFYKSIIFLKYPPSRTST